MTAAYNPFEILNIPMLKRIAQHGNHFIVLQRFNWPGIASGRGFTGTPYTDQLKAAQHVSHLSEKEGKVLNLNADAAKITELINDPKYCLFLNTFRDPNWDSRILKHYQRIQFSASALKRRAQMERKNMICGITTTCRRWGMMSHCRRSFRYSEKKIEASAIAGRSYLNTHIKIKIR